MIVLESLDKFLPNKSHKLLMLCSSMSQLLEIFECFRRLATTFTIFFYNSCTDFHAVRFFHRMQLLFLNAANMVSIYCLRYEL